MKIVVFLWLVVIYLLGTVVFHHSLLTIIDRSNVASAGLVDENFEYLIAALYLLYFISGRAMSAAWRSTGAKGTLLFLWDVLVIPFITFYVVIQVIPAKFQGQYINLLFQKDWVLILIFIAICDLAPKTFGNIIWRSDALKYSFDSWKSHGTLNMMFSQYPPKTISDTTPWILLHFISLGVWVGLFSLMFR